MTDLTNRGISAARPGDVLRDATTPGLHLRCFENSKAFYLYFRTRDGRERRPKLGDFGVITLDQARRMARKMLGLVAEGRDPVAEQNGARPTLTVADLLDRYLREYARAEKKAKSCREDERNINVVLLPKLGALYAAEVRYEHISALHQELKATPYLANRVLALLSKAFNLAERWGIRPNGSNPCRHVARFTERRRKRCMRSDEAPIIAAALARHEQTSPQSVAFIYLLILTGARPDEIRRARWDSLEGSTLRLCEHKADRTGEDRVIHLPPAVMRLLERLPRTTGTLTGIVSPRKLWERIREEAGCPDLRLYDLRRTFASAALKAGYSLPQIGELLGHSSEQTTKGYTYLLDGVAQEAAVKTAGILEAMLAPP